MALFFNFLLIVLLFYSPWAASHLEKNPASIKEGVSTNKTETIPTKQEPEKEENKGWGLRYKKLTGNWKELRNQLTEKGLNLALFYSAELASNFAGGIKKGSVYMGRAKLLIEENFEKLFRVEGLLFHTSFVSIHGKGLSQYTGDIQWTSNIEATPISIRLYDLWIQQNFMEDQFSILAGIYDWNSEFNVTDSALVFLNSSFGNGLEITQSPVNGFLLVSTYPYAAFGGRFKLEIPGGFYIKTAVMDGVAGPGQNTGGPSFHLGGSDGLFFGTEVGYTRGGGKHKDQLPGKYALGVWSYTETVDSIVSDVVLDTPERKSDYGGYVLAEQAILKELSLFVRYGAASGVNRIAANLAYGVVLNQVTNLFDTDQIGFGMTIAWNGKEYMAQQQIPTYRAETTLEWFYRFEVAPGFSFQPDLQWVICPNMDPTLENAWNAFLRFDLTL